MHSCKTELQNRRTAVHLGPLKVLWAIASEKPVLVTNQRSYQNQPFSQLTHRKFVVELQALNPDIKLKPLRCH
jgi:hypothetical protein